MIRANILPNNQLIVKENTVADGVMFDKVVFTFPSTWNGFSKTAVFSSDTQEPILIVLQESNPLCMGENCCYIPFEVLKQGGFYLSVFGVQGEKRATSTKEFVNVLESGFAEGEAPCDPTPTEYEQIINLITETNEIAQQVRNDADSGVFKGEKGEKGDRGEVGYSGVYYGTQEPTEENHPLWINPEGGGAMIDQSYSPTSPNPQSGKAIAEALQNIALNTFYPVGSIYMSVNPTSPATLLGGSWEQIKDTFLLASGDSFAVGSAGGEMQVTLSDAQMPSHSHYIHGWATYGMGNGVETDRGASYVLTKSAGSYNGEVDNWGEDTFYTGGNQPHNNMPPYLAVCIWKRTA